MLHLGPFLSMLFTSNGTAGYNLFILFTFSVLGVQETLTVVQLDQLATKSFAQWVTTCMMQGTTFVYIF